MAQSESELFLLASTGNEAAFERFFKTYYQSLLRYAYVPVRDEVMAEEIDADGWTRFLDRLRLKARFELGRREQVADRAAPEREVRVAHERGVLRARVVGGRVLRRHGPREARD